jgi:hypothetical protein
VNKALDSLRAWPPSALEQKYVKDLEAMALQAGLLEPRKGHHCCNPKWSNLPNLHLLID